MNEKILYILCGLPGSGKSTWARKMVEENKALCVSRDAIRTMAGAGKYIFDKENVEPLVKTISDFSIIQIVKSVKFDVILDETNLTVNKRSSYIDIAITLKSKPIIVHFTETENNVDNRMNGDPRGYPREKWEQVIGDMKKIFEPPTEDECMVIRINPSHFNFGVI